jgi:hypothetical protein
MTTTMTSNIEQKLLELVANAGGFKYMMYVPRSFPHRSGLLYKREHALMSVWNPLVDDGDLFRLAVAAPSVNLQRIIDSAAGSDQEKLGIRCAYIRESFVQAVVKAVTDSPSAKGFDGVFEGRAVGECQQ